jgi:hypothetical protein
MLRIKVALMMALAVFGAAACSSKTGGAALPDDMDLGNAQSKVTVVEYASVGCPVCAKWYREVYPAFKTKYVDSGKIHYVFREMLVGGGPEIAVAASGFLVARCAGEGGREPCVLPGPAAQSAGIALTFHGTSS